jgi:hypothetical protein
MVDILRHEDFVPHLDKLFSFNGWHGTLRLDHIDQPRHAGNLNQSRTPFTLIFHGTHGNILPEGLYIATVDGATNFEIYVMPIHTPAADRQEYQAVFN